MIPTTGSSPPLNNVIYSDIIYISLDPLTRGEFCATITDFRTRLNEQVTCKNHYEFHFHNYTYLELQVPIVTFVQIGRHTCETIHMFQQENFLLKLPWGIKE